MRCEVEVTDEFKSWWSDWSGRMRQPAQAPPCSPRMVWERGPMASGKASIRARVGCVAAARRRRSVSILLQAQVAVCRGSAVSGGRGVAGADVFSARCWRLPLGASSTGAGGWVARAFPPAGAAQIRGRSLGGGGGRRVDHQIAGAVLASRFARCRGPAAFPVGVDSPRRCATGAADKSSVGALSPSGVDGTTGPGTEGHSHIHRFRLCVTVLQRFAVHPARCAAVRRTASCAWPGPTIACALGGAGRDELESNAAHATHDRLRRLARRV